MGTRDPRVDAYIAKSADFTPTKRKKAPKPEAAVPSDLAAALKKNRKAAATENR